MKKLFIASKNKGKIDEIKEILSGMMFEFKSLLELNEYDVIEETGKTFEENALIKAQKVFEYTRTLTLADDSGLEVDALNGEPGVYSARYAGENATDEKNCGLLLDKMKNVLHEKRKAHFKCVIALYNGNNNSNLFKGLCEGKIILEKRGMNGFGYDPLFVPDGFDRTFAELDSETKNRISHRGKALAKLRDYLADIE